MNGVGARPDGRRRLAAIAAIVVFAAVAVGTVVSVLADPLRVLAEILLLAVLVGAAWIALTRAGTRRRVATIVAVVALVALAGTLIGAEGYLMVSLSVRILALVVALGLTKYALRSTVVALKQSETPGTPSAPPPAASCS